MTVLAHDRLSLHISNWIKDYAVNAGVKTLVLGLSGGIDSALVALLCKMTRLPLVCVNMPCNSSSSALGRSEAFAKEYDLNLMKVDLTEAHKVIYDQAKLAVIPGANMTNPIAVGGLSSCLRAPTLSFFANATRGLIVGTGNRSEDHITRYFQKYGDGCVDISPISDLFKSEVYDLFAYLAGNTAHTRHAGDPSSGTDAGSMAPSAMEIYKAKPTADLWGPDSGQEDEKELGITYDEIEWADREDQRTARGNPFDDHGIIFSNNDPAKRHDFFRYTGRQQEVICRLHQLEKISRHKMNSNLPCCSVRNIAGLVS